jgi:protease IV
MRRFRPLLATIGVWICASACLVMNNKIDLPFGKPGVQAKHLDGEPEARKVIAVISLQGEIGSAERFGINPDDVRAVLARLSIEPELAAVLLHVNSPGGSSAASEEILRQFERFRDEEKVPLFAYFSELAASGGYYISLAAEHITANPNAVTGSIGVISVFVSAERLVKEKLAVDVVTVKSGSFKDSGSVFRTMEKTEVEYWQQLVAHTHKIFTSRVQKARNMTPEKVVSISDGRVFHSQSALEGGLIDQIGTLDDALAHVRTKLGDKNAKAVQFGVNRVSFSLLGSQVPTPLDSLTMESLASLYGRQMLYMALSTGQLQY